MEEQKKRGGCLKWAMIAGAGLVGIAVLGAIAGPPEDSVEDVGAAVEPAAPVNAPTISAAEFAALQTGMSYDDAAAIIGSPGELLSENEIAGTRTQMFQWEGEGGFGANANAMFQNGKLIQKSQFGLE